MKNLLIFSVLIIVSAITFFYSIPDVSKKYNVLLIVSDSLRFDVLGVNGGAAKTPNIDWLASNGTSFVNAHSTSPRTLPSSVGMLTGVNPGNYPFIPKTKARDRYIVPDSENLLAEVLTDAGYYATAYLSNPYSYVSNNIQGFDIVKNIGKVTKVQKENLSSITDQIRNAPAYQKIYLYGDYILNLKMDQTIFSLMWIEDPHLPYAPPNDYKNKIIVNPEKIPLPYKKYTWNYDATSLTVTQYERDYTKSLYVKEVESMDERVGIIIRALKQKNLLEKTILVFTADHGEHFGEHELTSHGGSYFEELLHVPLIFFGPGIPKGRVVRQLVSSVDLMPTLEELLQLEQPIYPQDRSFAGLFHASKIKSRPHYLTGTRLASQKYVDAVLYDNYKLVSLTDGTYELFNISSDSTEQLDKLTELPDVSVELIKLLKKFRERYGENALRLSNNLSKAQVGQGKDEDENVKRLKSLGYAR